MLPWAPSRASVWFFASTTLRASGGTGSGGLALSLKVRAVSDLLSLAIPWATLWQCRRWRQVIHQDGADELREFLRQV